MSRKLTKLILDESEISDPSKFDYYISPLLISYRLGVMNTWEKSYDFTRKIITFIALVFHIQTIIFTINFIVNNLDDIYEVSWVTKFSIRVFSVNILNLFSFAFEVLIAYNFSTLKLIIFIHHRETFNEIFDMIRTEFWDFKDEDHGKEKEVLFVRNSRKMKKMLGRFLTVFPVIGIIYILRPIIMKKLPLPFLVKIFCLCNFSLKANF